MNCPECGSNLLHCHKLIDDTVSPMKNKSKIIYPKCSVCGHPIEVPEIEENISASRKVLLISGTAGAGKTALGQLIESKSDYIFIDGDAISKRVNHYARLDPSATVPDYQKETIRTMLVLLGLGYDVVVGYVINQEVIKWYYEGLAKYQITAIFRVLVPERNVCLQRDIDRECWTAGAEYVDRWYDEQRAYLRTDPEICIDSSQETLADTFANHFQGLLPSRQGRKQNGIQFTDVCFITEDVLRLRAFYEAIFGGTTEGNEVHSTLVAGGVTFTFDYVAPLQENSVFHYVSTGGANNVIVGFNVDDVDAEYQRLLPLGAEMLNQPTTHPWGARSFQFKDPDGNILNFRSLPKEK